MKNLLRNTLILIILLLGQLKVAAALKNLVPVDIVASTNLQLDLQIVEDDKSLDLSVEPELQFQIRPNTLHVSDARTAAFKMDVFLIDADGNREFIASQNTTIAKNRRRSKKKFTVTLDPSALENGINNLELEVFNTEGALANLYSLELQGFNKPDRSLDPLDIGLPTDLSDLADCPDANFGDCQLDYFFRKVNFEVRRESKAQTKLLKDDGQYTVVIPFASGTITRRRRVTQQSVLNPGTNATSLRLSPTSLVNELQDGLFEYDGNGLFFTLADNRINLTEINQGATGPAGPAGPAGTNGSQGPKGDKGDKGDPGSSANLNGAVLINGQVIGSSFTINADLFIPNAAVDGYVLSSDANGKATWTDISSLMTNGDNLGNHIASQNLDLASFDIINGDEITANTFFGSLTGTASLALDADNADLANYADLAALATLAINANNATTANTANLAILALDADNADLANYADLAALATTAIGAEDFTINGDLTISTGAVDGYVLSSDSNGKATWVDTGSLVVNGDDLGNHIASQNLNMSSFSILNAVNITATNLIGSLNGTASLALDADNADLANYADLAALATLAINANNATTANTANLAILALDAGNADLANYADLAALATAAIGAEDFTINGDLIISTGAVDGYVLSSDSNGKATWVDSASLVVNGDDLGNHTASQNLNMSSFSILNATNMIATNFIGSLNGTASLALDADNADLANYADLAALATLAINANNATTANTANLAVLALDADNADLANYADFAALATLAIDANNATTANTANLAILALDADNADLANYADLAALATLAIDANNATTANTANLAILALDADNADLANYADLAALATLAIDANNATTANTANLAVLALDADNADTANTADIAIAANNFTIDGTLTIPTGASNGYLLTSDANGNASWQASTAAAGPEFFTASSTTTQGLNTNSFANVPGMLVSSVTFQTGDIINVTFSGTYHTRGTNHNSYSILRFTFGGTAMGPQLPVKNNRRNTDTYGPPHVVMLRCGAGPGEISPGTYDIRLQGQADAGPGTVNLTFGPGGTEYAIYVQILR